jgi:hypothetical protein
VLAALDPTIKPVPEDAEKAEKAIREFQRLVGFEEKLSDYGFTESDLQKIAEKSGTRWASKPPRYWTYSSTASSPAPIVPRFTHFCSAWTTILSTRSTCSLERKDIGRSRREHNPLLKPVLSA